MTRGSYASPAATSSFIGEELNFVLLSLVGDGI